MDKNKVIQSKNGKITLVLVSLMMIGLFLFGLLNVLATSDIISTDPTKEINTNETTTDKLSDGDYQDSLRDTNIVQELIDNKYKSYDVSEKEILIEDLNNITIIEMKLVSEYKERVSEGTNIKVANILITNWGIKDLNLSKGIKSYDINDGYKLLNKEFKLKYKTVIAEKRCNKITDNKTLVETTECYIYDKEILTEFELLSELPQKEIEIGIFTDTILGEEIEWTITLDGIEILEWASYLVTNVVSHYKLDEASGTNAYDELNTNNGTNVGPATVNVTGKVKTAYDFDGNDYVNVGNYINPSSDFTINAWFNADSVTGNHRIFCNGVSTTSTPMIVFGVDDGKLDSYVRDNAGHVQHATETDTISTDVWYMATMTWDSATDTTRMYLNGTSNSAFTGTAIGTTTLDVGTIGVLRRDTFVEFWDGTIDEVTVWNKTLNSTEVQDVYVFQSANITYPFHPSFCNFSGYVFDEDSTALNGANVTIWNQYNVSESYEDSTDSNGYWSLNVSNSTNTYMVGAYYNDSIIGQLKPYVSGSC